MRVFLSWSGAASRQIAEVLYVWIPRVLQAVEPFLSSQDIEKGERWLSSISTNLENIDVGIVVVTKSNIIAPWINFEAGALSKKIDRSRIIPVLFGITDTDLVNHPLAQFQYVKIEKDDLLRLFRMLNQSCPKPLPDVQFEETFNLWFDKHFDLLQQIKPGTQEKKEKEAAGKPDSTEARFQRMESALDEILNYQRRSKNSKTLLYDQLLDREFLLKKRNDYGSRRLLMKIKGGDPISTEKGLKILRDIESRGSRVKVLGIGADGILLDADSSPSTLSEISKVISDANLELEVSISDEK